MAIKSTETTMDGFHEDVHAQVIPSQNQACFAWTLSGCWLPGTLLGSLCFAVVAVVASLCFILIHSHKVSYTCTACTGLYMIAKDFAVRDLVCDKRNSAKKKASEGPMKKEDTLCT